MEQIFEFFAELAPVDYVLLFVSALSALVLFIRTGRVGKILKEVVPMYYANRRKPSYLKDEPLKGQSFSNLKPVYRLNKATGELEETDEVVDITELVNSFKDIALDNLLERFIPVANQQLSDDIVEYNNMSDDVDFMREMSERAESYREKYHMSDDLTISQVFDEVQKRSSELKAKIDKAQQVVKNAEKVNSEVKDGEKVQENQQAKE